MGTERTALSTRSEVSSEGMSHPPYDGGHRLAAGGPANRMPNGHFLRNSRSRKSAERLTRIIPNRPHRDDPFLEANTTFSPGVWHIEEEPNVGRQDLRP